MSDTPRTDAALALDQKNYTGNNTVNEARTLERELAEAKERIKRLEDSVSESIRIRKEMSKRDGEVSQVCGKALGYPWFKDDQKSFPGADESWGVCVGEHVASTIACELAGKYTEALRRIVKLENAVSAASAEFFKDGDDESAASRMLKAIDTAK